MRPGLTIGEFAQITRLSVRTLRRYHERGLLEPAVVDPDSGYRYYTSEQIPAAQVIHRLRELDMPLREVREVMDATDPDARASLVAAHLSRLESELDRTRMAVTSLRRLLRPEPGRLDVELRSAPPMTVAAVGETVDRARVLEWYDTAMDELDAALAGRRVTGPPGGRYAGELFTDGRGDVLIYRPITEPPAVGRVRPVILPAVELAVTVHPGPHDDIDVTYGRLGAYVTDHALVVDGPVHETYLVGPRDDPDPDSWRTEVGWPIFRVSPA
ncbi:MerR family transcriptional regulator [Actinoallomurus iriomotensis]|uniref:MerR family transcriptional regulator n=1 Tax=Actinoallomurus iriomotensis TaxID=478107 RepID=A0A9W6VS26_9ACTN|nr:MerR family transcriptional regulator [Actinoallomurus iriomotensis]GLY77092.1 MerR family transcriptional regulator [Actinoallomurus iriomotensis]